MSNSREVVFAPKLIVKPGRVRYRGDFRNPRRGVGRFVLIAYGFRIRVRGRRHGAGLGDLRQRLAVGGIRKWRFFEDYSGAGECEINELELGRSPVGKNRWGQTMPFTRERFVSVFCSVTALGKREVSPRVFRISGLKREGAIVSQLPGTMVQYELTGSVQNSYTTAGSVDH